MRSGRLFQKAEGTDWNMTIVDHVVRYYSIIVRSVVQNFLIISINF